MACHERAQRVEWRRGDLKPFQPPKKTGFKAIFGRITGSIRGRGGVAALSGAIARKSAGNARQLDV